jgi:hypothetical protein
VQCNQRLQLSYNYPRYDYLDALTGESDVDPPEKTPHHMQAQATLKLLPLQPAVPSFFRSSTTELRTKSLTDLQENPSTKASRTSIANMSLSNKLSITDVDLSGKRVLTRVSYLQIEGHNDELQLTKL